MHSISSGYTINCITANMTLKKSLSVCGHILRWAILYLARRRTFSHKQNKAAYRSAKTSSGPQKGMKIPSTVLYQEIKKLAFCTASMTGKAILRCFQPKIIIMEKNITNDGINVFQCHRPILPIAAKGYFKRWCQSTGAYCRLNGQSCKSKKLSLLERLIKTRYPRIKLLVQLRTDIAELVSRQFYDNELWNHRSFSGRDLLYGLPNWWIVKLVWFSDHPISQMAQPGPWGWVFQVGYKVKEWRQLVVNGMPGGCTGGDHVKNIP